MAERLHLWLCPRCLYSYWSHEEPDNIHCNRPWRMDSAALEQIQEAAWLPQEPAYWSASGVVLASEEQDG